MVEIEETEESTVTTTSKQEESQPLLNSSSESKPRPKSVRTKVPEVEVHLFRSGEGPIDTFKSPLGGWDQDQLEVRDILEKYGLKSVYAFNTQSGRGVPIRFNPKNGRSILPYKDGSLILIDGEPKDSLIKPITRILVGVAALTALIILVMKETPGWAKKLNFTGVNFNAPPWVLACVVIVFTRLRKRTRDFFIKRR
ncbi:hypothetical protein HanXRQr2_Chr11g0466801 [Helianthus annuus]|uniref:Uncharacterized protein n=1 Tax=Helianthus annuus TaxID=4232 RepID=A0A251T5W0_HELAN|nr:uncharacterized protein LOC110889089 [Helianthus annuus]KAF5779971.1 hypothetical protein HanXRQr2_Chr11g0466801 [Helianthus annuus]KAJ0873263.1 hypothetical protein HanPSC8_Chr11g0450641 [Helianthus annuus]